jgi:hypothetical protein
MIIELKTKDHFPPASEFGPETVTITLDGRAIATIKKGQVFVPCSVCGEEATELYCSIVCADA